MSIEEQQEKMDALEALQAAFPYTLEGLVMFAQVCLEYLIPGKPTINRTQIDILDFLFSGNKYRMIQASRGIAKTTLAGIYCAFMLIHFPHYRIVVFSQTGKRAKEIAGWVIKIFTRIDFMEPLLPDKHAGDKSSQTEGFDVNGFYKGGSKEPSVTCYSIEGGAQGARADIILADDIESLQNSRTAASRAWLEEQGKEFSSINQYGDIIYLGTPQSTDSIYNNLPGRGYQVRIWPGRYPTAEEERTYGGYLAPMFINDMQKDPTLRFGGGMDGTRGKPTTPEMYDEQILVDKEIEQGKSKFDLQFMLNTRLSDADRYPLKLKDFIFAPFTVEQGPVMPVWSTATSCMIADAPRYGNKDTDFLYRAFPKQYEWRKWDRKIMYIDPSGGGRNGDETAYAIVFVLGNMAYVWDINAVPGGYSEQSMIDLVEAAKEADCKEVWIETNYGHGALMAAVKPYFEAKFPVKLEGEHSVGQKEIRIIDRIEPLLSTHRLVVHERLAKSDEESVKHYEVTKRQVFRAFHQVSHINRDRDCLAHDDRVEALSGALARVSEKIAFDQNKSDLAKATAERQEWLKQMRDPRSHRALFSRAAVTVSSSRNALTSLESI